MSYSSTHWPKVALNKFMFTIYADQSIVDNTIDIWKVHQNLSSFAPILVFSADVLLSGHQNVNRFANY